MFTTGSLDPCNFECGLASCMGLVWELAGKAASQAHPDPLNQNLYVHSTQRFGEHVLSGGSPGEPCAAGLCDHDVGDIVTKGEGGQNGTYRGNEKDLTMRDAVEEGPSHGPCF